MSFLAELKRRNVFRAGIAYVVTAWLVAQVLELVLDSFGAPGWVIKTILVLLGAGLPFVLLFAWAFELTPEGLRREKGADQARAEAPNTGRRLDRAIIVVLVLAVAYFFWESRFAGTFTGPDPADAASRANAEAAESAAPGAAPTGLEQSVAVLPFMNMSANPEQEYFSDGITEEIINALVKIPNLSVPARTSVFAFKDRLQDVREIGRQLNVAHVLEGSIRSQGDQVRITAQLIKVDDGFHLWSETFDRSLENIFAVQEEIAAAIAEVLVGELGMAVQTVPNRTLDMTAYDLYLRGRALFRNRDERASGILEQATRADPDFAPAWAVLAMAYQIDGYLLHDNASQQRAITTARHALSLDPENVDALNAMASALRDTWQWAEAERYFDAALALDPQSAELLEDYAEFLCNVARWDEFLAVAERGFAIDPMLLPLADAYVMALAIHGRYAEALAVIQGFGGNNVFSGSTWPLQTTLASGDLDGAVTLIESAHPDTIAPENGVAMIRLLRDHGDIRSRDLLRATFAPDAQERYGGSFESALNVLANSGDEEYVIDTLLNQFRRAGWANPEEIWQPSMAPVRRHPRFQEVIEVLRLPQYWDEFGWPENCRREDEVRIICS